MQMSMVFLSAEFNNPQQCTATGAAMMLGVGVGIWDSYEEAAKLAKVSKRFIPYTENSERYNELYPIYKSLIRP